MIFRSELCLKKYIYNPQTGPTLSTILPRSFRGTGQSESSNIPSCITAQELGVGGGRKKRTIILIHSKIRQPAWRPWWLIRNWVWKCDRNLMVARQKGQRERTFHRGRTGSLPKNVVQFFGSFPDLKSLIERDNKRKNKTKQKKNQFTQLLIHISHCKKHSWKVIKKKKIKEVA